MEKRRRECAGCRPHSARVSESYSVWRAGSLLTLGFSTALCGMVQVRRRQTSGGRVNPGYGDPDRGTSVVQLRPIALRRGQFADRYPVTPVLACKQVWRKWRARLIWTIEKRRWDCAGCRAQSARVWEGDGPTARAFCRSRVSGHTDACTHVGVGGRWDRFSSIEKRRWDCAGCGAQSARVWEGDGATARAVCRPWVSGHTDACTQVDAGGLWDRFSTIEKR